MDNLSHSVFKDSSLIMQLLRDNLTVSDIAQCCPVVFEEILDFLSVEFALSLGFCTVLFCQSKSIEHLKLNA